MEEREDQLAARLGAALRAAGKTIACAESCTGGLVTSRLTDIPGSSDYVMGSVVSYTNDIKERLVGVRHETLAAHGAVSPETAREMADASAASSARTSASASRASRGRAAARRQSPSASSTSL